MLSSRVCNSTTRRAAHPVEVHVADGARLQRSKHLLVVEEVGAIDELSLGGGMRRARCRRSRRLPTKDQRQRRPARHEGLMFEKAAAAVPRMLRLRAANLTDRLAGRRRAVVDLYGGGTSSRAQLVIKQRYVDDVSRPS